MDRKKEEKEEFNESTAKLLIDSTLEKTFATNILTPATPDDDASTGSSDAFETWTLVTDKMEKTKAKDSLEDNGNRVEVLEEIDHDNEEEEDREPGEEKHEKDSLDVTTDEFSDGISIISESESMGRISPHPFVTDHLHDMNMKFSLNEHMDDNILNKLREEMDKENQSPLLIQQPSTESFPDQQIRQRRRSFEPSQDNQALQKSSQTAAISYDFPPFVKKGLQGIFYVGVAIALLGLYGRIVNPTWQPLAQVGGNGNSGELEQKLSDMELQNNLMRAEIDLLNKQVKYLSSINDPQQQRQYQDKSAKYKDYGKESKTFKAWAGNGDTLKPVDITKQDLRKPYKCPDGSFVEIANMCVEQGLGKDPSLVDQFGKVVEDLKQQSEAFKAFEDVAEELQGFQDNPFEKLQDVFSYSEAQTKQHYMKNKPIYQANEDNKEKLPPTGNQQKGEESYSSRPPKSTKYDGSRKSNKEYQKSDENKPSREFKKYHEHRKNDRDNSKESREWKSDNNSKERKYDNDNSKERNSKYFDDDSKENDSKYRKTNKQKRKFERKSNEEDDSGEWQEKYMKHREQQRKQNEQKYQDNNNWYFKRGNSRENKRSGEKQYR